MTQYADFIAITVVFLDLYIVATSRLDNCVRAIALQGATLALLPLMLWSGDSLDGRFVHHALISAGAFIVKGLLIPFLLFQAIREANVRREAEPFISLHVSVFIAVVLVGVSFWLATVQILPQSAPTTLLVPGAFAALMLGFLVLVGRRKAITQVVGYLMLENGIFIFAQTLLKEIPFVVELGILLDLLVGVLVMGVIINHISREFDHIDVTMLDRLRG